MTQTRYLKLTVNWEEKTTDNYVDALSQIIEGNGSADDISLESSKELPIPTLTELNNIPSFKTFLLMLRCLNTSDLGWFYMCFKESAIDDILRVMNNMKDIHDPEGFQDNLTTGEQAEFLEYLKDFRQYVDNTIGS